MRQQCNIQNIQESAIPTCANIESDFVTVCMLVELRQKPKIMCQCCAYIFHVYLKQLMSVTCFVLQ